MLFTCAICDQKFEPSRGQVKNSRRGKKLFACSRLCLNRLISVARVKPIPGRPNLGKTNPKYLARVAVFNAVKTGKLVRPKTCSECGKNPGLKKDGDARVEAHHVDYTRPLDVVWLCDFCHRQTIERVRGAETRHAKFTDVDVARIRQAVATGSKRVHIARTYGVHRSTIERMCAKQTWGHV